MLILLILISGLATWLSFVHPKYVLKNKSSKEIKYAQKSFLGITGLLFLLQFLLLSARLLPADVRQEATAIPTVTDQAIKPSDAIQSAQTDLVPGQVSPDNFNLVMAKVTHIVDGDTIDVDLGEGQIHRVRYIGIDTPESVAPGKTVECFAKNAAAKNRELVENKLVGLEKDVSETDRYGRLLRYVFMDGVFVNQVLVAEGFARASSYPPDIAKQEIFRQAEAVARNEGKGLWDVCAQATTRHISEAPKPTAQTQANAAQQMSEGSISGKSCTGPDLDCKDFATHAEAQAFFEGCGFSSAYDPMRLDNARGEGNGLACESLP